jgi:DMSO reductase family type II enzyme heme b subunit
MSENQTTSIKIESSDIYGLAAVVIFVLAAAVIVMSYFLFFRAPSAGATPAVVVQQSSTPSSAGAQSADEDDEYYDDEEYDDWVDEPIRVINEINLPDVAITKALFERNCMSCHGPDGQGNGEAAEYLIPRPRNFVTSPYRFAAEWADEYHIMADLGRTIRNGVPRSAMPAFGGVLSEEEIAGLAKFVFGLRDTDKVTVSEEEIDVGARPPLTVELVNHGKELFSSLACTACHGETGAGDGQLALTLVDFQQRPVRPADFTSGLFKSGQRSADIVRTILQGVPGTPMVSYNGILVVENEDTDEETYNTLEAWALAAYIRTLAPADPPVGIQSGYNIEVTTAYSEAMLTDPLHPAWLGIKPASLRVNPLQTRHSELTHADVRAVRFNGKIAVCVEWADSTLNILNSDEDRHPDGMSVMFGLNSSPSAVQVTAVEEQDAEPILNEWRWSADKQYVCANGDPSSEGIDYTLLGGWPFYVLSPQSTSKTGEPVQSMDGPECAVVESNGLIPQPPEQQGAVASAAWINGVWRVVIMRDLTTEDSNDAQFTNDLRVPISVSLWDGTEGAQLDALMVSSWHWLNQRP